jgi:hypothetical protein
MSTEPTHPGRPREAGGVWGSYPPYLEELERAVQRIRDLCDTAEGMDLGHNITVGEIRKALEGDR